MKATLKAHLNRALNGAEISARRMNRICRQTTTSHSWFIIIPAEVKAFYMARDPERNELALGVDVLAPEGYGEVIGGGERATSLEFLEGTDRAASTAAGGFRVVSGFTTLWQRSSRWIRYGHRALHRLDVWHRTRPRDDSIPPHALSAASVVLACADRQAFDLSGLSAVEVIQTHGATSATDQSADSQRTPKYRL